MSGNSFLVFHAEGGNRLTANRQSFSSQSSYLSEWQAASVGYYIYEKEAVLSGNLSVDLISTSWLCFPAWWLACVWILSVSVSACCHQALCQTITVGIVEFCWEQDSFGEILYVCHMHLIVFLMHYFSKISGEVIYIYIYRENKIKTSSFQ